MPFDSGGLTILDEDECVSLLKAAPLGRIVFTHRALPAVQPVNYTLVDGDLVIRTSSASRLASAAVGAVVAFEIDDYDAATRQGWSVVVVGVARSVTDESELRELSGLALPTWAPGDRSFYLRIHPKFMSGRRTGPARSAPPPDPRTALLASPSESPSAHGQGMKITEDEGLPKGCRAGTFGSDTDSGADRR